MQPFDYFEPKTIDEAVALLERHTGQAELLAGGTDLLVEIKEKIRRPHYVINLKKIPAMNALTYTPGVGLHLGALVTVRQVEIDPVVRATYPALAQAARELGSIQIRNRATVAGNVCRASPSADTPPPLIAAGATITLHGPGGERSLPLHTFFTGPGQTVRQPNEVVTQLTLPDPPPHTGQVYLKLGRRRAMELATVGVAVSLTLGDGLCRDVRLVLGAVAPTPIRATAAEASLRGQPLNETTIRQAAHLAREAARPISDVRASDDYRRQMVVVLTERALRQVLINQLTN